MERRLGVGLIVTEQALTASSNKPAELINFTSAEKRVILASNSTRLAKMEENQVVTLATTVIMTKNMRLGIKSQGKEELEAEVNIIVSDLSRFKMLTDKDIILALENGLNGDYQSQDQQVFFNSSNFSRWLKIYQNETKASAMKKKLIADQQAEKMQEKPIPPLDQQKILAIEIAVSYRLQKENNPELYIFSAHTLYEDLERFDIYRMAVEDKKEVFDCICKRYPRLNQAELIQKSKVEAYNRFITKFVNDFRIINFNSHAYYLYYHDFEKKGNSADDYGLPEPTFSLDYLNNMGNE